MSTPAIVLLALRATLGLVLVAAATAKLVDLHGFGETAQGLGVPERWASSAALALAASELAVGTVSLLGVWPLLADIAVFALVALFVWVTLFAVRRRPQLRCRCFGALANMRLGVRALIRSLVLLVRSRRRWLGRPDARGRRRWLARRTTAGPVAPHRLARLGVAAVAVASGVAAGRWIAGQQVPPWQVTTVLAVGFAGLVGAAKRFSP